MTVRDYLAQARAAHKRYRESAGRINKEGKVSHVPDVFATTAAITEALKARCLAEAADPQRVDPAWVEDETLMKASNADLISFYVKYLSPPAAYITEGAA